MNAPAAVLHSTDETFLSTVTWRKSAPAPLKQVAARGDWQTSAAILHDRARLRLRDAGRRHSLVSLDDCLQWSESVLQLSTDTVDLLRSIGDVKQRPEPVTAGEQVQAWLREIAADDRIEERLAALWLLHVAADAIDADAYWSLWRFAASQLAAAEPFPAADTVADVLRFDALHAAELMWLTGLALDDVRGSKEVRQAGRNWLRAEIDRRTDTDGTPQAQLVERLAGWFGTFCRASQVGEMHGRDLLGKKVSKRLRETVIRSSALVGSTWQHDEDSTERSVLCATAGLLEMKPDEPPMAWAPSGNGRSKRSTDPDCEPSMQSDWAELACLRNDWSRQAETCVVRWNESVPHLSLSVAGRSALYGEWALQLQIDDQPVPVSSDWECVCWYSDAEADYLELQTVPAPGIQITRQVLFARDAQLLFLADSVAKDRPAVIRYACSLPHGGKAELDRPTREARVRFGNQRLRCFPVSLPDDRVHSADGALHVDDRALTLEVTERGTGLVVPLVLDWSVQRRKAAADWRRLTVCEDGRKVGSGEAIACRLRIGEDQWLFYHSLVKPPVGRTYVGQHTLDETVVECFSSEGESEPLVMVEYN